MRHALLPLGGLAGVFAALAPAATPYIEANSQAADVRRLQSRSPRAPRIATDKRRAETDNGTTWTLYPGQLGASTGTQVGYADAGEVVPLGSVATFGGITAKAGRPLPAVLGTVPSGGKVTALAI